MDKLTVTVLEAAEALGISTRTIYPKVDAGEFPHLRFGDRIVIPIDALERMCAEASKAS